MNRDLNALGASLWAQLVAGAEENEHPFHLGVLATGSPSGIAQRTVVLRHVDPAAHELRCHTDRRSGKVAELAADASVSWLFYDPDQRVQLRLTGSAEVYADGDVVGDAWRSTRLLGRRCYLVDPPGDPRPDPTVGLPHHLSNREPTQAESEPGRANFAVVSTRVHTCEWLLIRFSGHLRARFEYRDDGTAHATWLTP